MTAMVQAVVEGAHADGIVDVEVDVVSALEPDIDAVLAANGHLLGTPANLGYMSGALKHWFDTIYNAALGVTAGRPYGLFVHGETDTTGAILGVEKITTGLEWRLAQEPVSLLGPVDQTGLDRCWELGAAIAASLMD